MSDILLRIILNEQQQIEKEAACEKIMVYLRDIGVPGATMRRGEAGVDYNGRISLDILEDTYYNNLPLIIESVMDRSLMKKVEGGLKQMIAHGQVSINQGMEEMGRMEGKSDEGPSFYSVRIYTRENSRLIKKDEYEKILLLLQKHKAIWATVTKAVAGYGRDGVIYGRHLFPISEHLPLVIECIIDGEHLQDLLKELGQVISEQAVFTAPAELVINR